MNTRIRIALASTLLLICGTVLAGPSCQTGQLISQTFNNGSKWEMCWEHKIQEGILLKELFFTTPGGTRTESLERSQPWHRYM